MTFPNLNYPKILNHDRAMCPKAPRKVSTQFDGQIQSSTQYHKIGQTILCQNSNFLIIQSLLVSYQLFY